jgi:organic radical activating enzyme
MNKIKIYQDQIEKLSGTPTFCVLPWIHLATRPNGDMRLCCTANASGAGEDHEIGLIKNEDGSNANFGKVSPMSVWNNSFMKNVRNTMLNGDIPASCKGCFKEEEQGIVSKRIWETGTWHQDEGIDIQELIEQTKEDGTVPEKLQYLDLRLGHTCNIKCIMCSPHDSSKWVSDWKKLVPILQDSNVKQQMGWDKKEFNNKWYEKGMFWDEIHAQIPNLKQVYFAGGEPLIMKEHYYLLEKLIDAGKTDIRLQYNTNFSELAFKDKHVFEYWQHFKNVSVGASLDAMGPQAELVRKGTNWAQTIANRERMIQEVPHVDFYVSSTVSSMNVLHVLDFHKEWTRLGLIKAKDWNINICQSPEWYRIDIFPTKFKEQVIYPAYEEHIAWLEPQDNLRRATTGYQSLLSLMRGTDASELWPRFQEETAKLDGVRNEDFWAIFPEFASLR